jgi:uncharacterized coiled-coil protein SlyX
MSSTKDMMKAMEARIEALEKQLGGATIKELEKELAKLSALIAETTKGKRKQKAASDGEEKPKREFKPSAARDAWRALCDAVRAVHKKDAMKIAKILKTAGHMTPTEKQIEEAIKQFEEGGEAPAGGTPSATDVDVDMTSASEADEEEKPLPPSKKAGGRKPK